MQNAILLVVLTLLVASGVAPIVVPAAYLLLCWWPGYLILRSTGIGQTWNRTGRIVLSVALSLAVTPVVLNLLWRLGHGRGMLLGAVAAALAIGLVMVRMIRSKAGADLHEPATQPFAQFRSTRILLIVIGTLVACTTLGTYWPVNLRGYPMPVGIHDFVKHHAVLFSLQCQRLPIGNPFYAPDAGGPVYYYHFFYLVPATIRVLAPAVSIHFAFGLHAAVVALAAVGCLYLLAKRLGGGEAPAALAVVLATVVGGLDIIPVVVKRIPVVSLDAWADHVVRIHNLLALMIWSPQNMLGLLIVLVVVYILSEKGFWRGWHVLGPVLGVAAWGSSPWPAMVLCEALGVWWICELVRRRRQPHAQRPLAGAVLVGAVAALLCWPVLAGYAEMSHRHGKSLTMQWPHHWSAWLGRLVRSGPLANLLDFPWLIVVEMGPLLLFPLLLTPREIWKRAWRDDGLRLLMLCGPVAMIGFLIVRSHFMYNDFGQKTMMVALAAGVVLAGCAVRAEPGERRKWNPLGWSLAAGSSPGRRRAAQVLFVGLLILGSPIGWYEAPLTTVRRYLPVSRLPHLAPPGSRLAYVEGTAWQWMREHLPKDAVLQADPDEDRAGLLQVVERQMGVTVIQEDTMVFYPADYDRFQRRLARVQKALYEAGSAEELQAALRDCMVTHVFVGSIEQKRWKCLGPLSDTGRFERLVDMPGGSVYALR